MGEAQQSGVAVGERPGRSGWSMALWGLVALATHLALIDVGIETFAGGSPLRWWVSPTLLFLAVLSVWAWRPGGRLLPRFGPAGAAGTPVLIFLAVLAATAWMPLGQANGLRAVLQPTPTVLTSVLALGVLLAAVVLLGAARSLQPTTRLAARALVLLVTAYALLAVVAAVRADLPFASLLQGGALWQRLPRWLQGTFVGGLVMTPLAALAALASIGVSLRRKKPVLALVQQAMALTMAVVMTASGLMLGAPGAGGPAASSGPASKPAPLTAEPIPMKVLMAEWTNGQDPVKFADQLFTAVDAQLKKPGADPSDVPAAAAALGHDSQKIFAFLKDRILLEPYAGQLRGARGTLVAGAGNALDRALLAQALLGASGTTCRLMTGTLPQEHARALLGRYLASDPLQPPLADLLASPDAAALEANVRSSAAALGLRPEKGLEIARRQDEHMKAFWRWTEEQNAAQLRFVSGELARAGVKAGVRSAPLLDRLTRHYWIQLKDASGAWSDFDPSLPDARPGVAYAADGRPIGGVPREEIHRLAISLVMTVRAGSAPTREVLLEGNVAASDALFTPVQFEINPADASFDAAGLLDMERARVMEVLRNLKRFQPVLRVGSRVVNGSAFDLDGKTYSPGAGERPTASAGDLFGGLFGGGEESGGPRQFQDLQLVVRLTGPGRAPAVQTRTLLRAADVGTPRYAPPLIWSDVFVQPQWLGEEFVAHEALEALVAGRGAVTQAMQASRDGKPLHLPPQSAARPARPLMELALLRQRATAGILRAQPGLRALVDAPLVTLAHEQLAGSDPQGGLRLQSSVDIMANAIRFLDRGGAASQATFDAAVRQGVMDCTLETSFVQDVRPGSAALSGAVTFQAAAAEHRPIVVAAPQDREALQRAGLGEADQAWIGAAENPSTRLVATSAPNGSAAWWSVAEDGTTVLRVSGGWGQGMTEHQFMNLLKSIAGADCLLREVTHAKHHPGSSAAVWGAASCLVLTTASVTMMLMHIHGVVCTLLLGVEILNVVGTAIAADGERVHTIVVR